VFSCTFLHSDFPQLTLCRFHPASFLYQNKLSGLPPALFQQLSSLQTV
jgi:hypothetical protein